MHAHTHAHNAHFATKDVCTIQIKKQNYSLVNTIFRNLITKQESDDASVKQPSMRNFRNGPMSSRPDVHSRRTARTSPDVLAHSRSDGDLVT